MTDEYTQQQTTQHEDGQQQQTTPGWKHDTMMDKDNTTQYNVMTMQCDHNNNVDNNQF
jgi:hypothetical protein